MIISYLFQKYIFRQIENQQKDLVRLTSQWDEYEEELQQSLNSDIKLQAYRLFLKRITDNHRATLRRKHENKLCNLYNGDVP